MAQQYLGELKLSTAVPHKIYAELAGAPVTGKVDGDWTKKISKNGGALGAMTVTITEDGFGWYDLTISSSHTDTLGILTLNFTATGVEDITLQFRVASRIIADLSYPTVSGRSTNVSAAGEADANVATWLTVAVNALISGRVDANAQVVGDKTGYALSAAGVDAIWDEDIQAAHGTADTAGFLLRVLGRAISTRTNNANLNALLGVADTAGKDIANTLWDATAASYNVAGSMGAIMNYLAALTFPNAAAIADAVWDENIVDAHGAVKAAGLLLRVLGSDISTRVNSPSLDLLLGVPDSATQLNIADAIWDEDIQGVHGFGDTAGLMLRVLGRAISIRANNPTLDSLLGVPDTATATIAWTIIDEVVDGSNHTTVNSVGRRVRAIDDLTKASGTGDLAVVLTQVKKLDLTALSGSPVADSVADKLNDIASSLTVVGRNVLVAINTEGTTLHIEAAVELSGMVQTTPWVRCQAQIFDEAGAIILGGNIGIGDFGAINVRGFFSVDVSPHGVVAGKTYQIKVIIDDGGSDVIDTTKAFTTIQV